MELDDYNEDQELQIISRTGYKLKDLARAFQSLDKSGLGSYQFKNRVLILPFIILSGPLMPLEEQMWKFRTENSSKACKEILLPPFIFFLSTSFKPVDN